MPKDENKPGMLARAGMTARKWLSRNAEQATEIKDSDAFAYDGQMTIAALLGSGRRTARSRAAIYQKWSYMEGDPIISSALSLLVTAALGGHETTGDVVFIEQRPGTEKDAAKTKMVEELRGDLLPILNDASYTLAYNGAAFGDAYARPYFKAGKGLVGLDTSELIRTPMVQPYERASQTIGFHVYVGPKQYEKLSVTQLVRLKMPRTVWVPQASVVEKALRVALTEDDPDKLPILPSLAGGSFLYQAEEAYDNLYASLLGLVGQRWMDSIDEQMVGVNLESMTKGQQEKFLDSIIKMLKKSKEMAEKAVSGGTPVMERIRHIIPVYNEKQLMSITPGNGGAPGRASTITIDDVMMHAKMLAGALGVDLSMLGFSELLSGGLGDGGFFRVSAQAAQRAQVLRTALSDCFDSLIDLHTMHRYGVVFEPSERPWVLNYYGAISALENERQRTRQDGMNAGMLLTQTMQVLKDLGANEKIMGAFLSKQMMVDEDLAKTLAKLATMKPQGMEGDGFGPEQTGSGLMMTPQMPPADDEPEYGDQE